MNTKTQFYMQKSYGPMVLIVSLSAFASFGCATSPNVTTLPPVEPVQKGAPSGASATPAESAVQQQGAATLEYRITPGDELDVKFFYNKELNESVVVRPDGKISLQLVDDVAVAGLTPQEVDAILTQAYSKELKEPKISVLVRSFSNQRVYVGGEVNRPTVVDLVKGMTPMQAVLQAGGVKDTGDLKQVVIVSQLNNESSVTSLVDLEGALASGTAQMKGSLRPGDIVYVPKTGIARANLFVDQYIRKLLMFEGVRIGLRYDLNNTNKD